MRRLLSVAMVSTLGVGVAVGPASASPGSTSVSHFSGRAGSAILTDCSLASPPGTHCRAVSVIAFEQRVNDNGVRIGGPGVDVTVFDVTIIPDPPFFSAEVVGTGFSDQASVRIARNLSSGTAAASDVPLDPAGSVSVEVQWQGFGATSKFRFHDMFSDPFSGFHNSRTSGTFRSADASGTLDGVPVDDTALFPSSLQTDKFGSIDRFAPLASSATMVAAAAAAASVAHTRETSAFTTLSNCPPSPPVGTSCTGVLVSADALTGRADRQPLDQRSVFADFFDLVFTADGLEANFVGSGFDGAATVNVDSGLAGATATANLELTCFVPGCTPGQIVALTAAWTGQGDTQKFRFHSQFAFDGSHGNTIGSGQAREATTVATIGGSSYTDFPGSTGVIQTVAINSTAK